jgi:TPR repeat protein
VSVKQIFEVAILVVILSLTWLPFAQGQHSDAWRFRSNATADLAQLHAMAEKGDPDAQYQLAEKYRIGFPIEQDYKKALELYNRSAEQGFAASQFRLGDLHEKGEILEQDLNKAVEFYRKAAEQGHPGAQNALAHIYQLGSGVEQDMAAAMVWYRKAALQGDEWSQLALGDQYRIGLAVPRDLVQSTKWYRRAAERGNIFAQFELGNAYRYGNGIDRDVSQAIEWYRMSSEAGNPSAKLALTELDAGDTETVSELLAHAEDQVANLALTTPKGHNAYETYQLVLSIQPDNQAALAGFEQIGLKYVELASRAVAKGDLRKANHYARKAVELAPEHPLVQAMAVPVEAVRPTSEEKTRPVEILTGTKASQQTSIEIQELVEDGETSIALSPFAAQKSSTGSSDELVIRSVDKPIATFGSSPIQEESLSQDLDSEILEILGW